MQLEKKKDNELKAKQLEINKNQNDLLNQDQSSLPFVTQNTNNNNNKQTITNQNDRKVKYIDQTDTKKFIEFPRQTQ